ncbi:unnamed protein product, partial [Angiostrongylus costaricensis]|uniref:DUF19 domain-containing protein n=1 Tax=Angiostrongylus costaricensis TaxID=334426 RepID=A0A158PH05_ANGCS
FAENSIQSAPNTFTCADGSCIPEDWVGDGEADCDDRHFRQAKVQKGCDLMHEYSICTQGASKACTADEGVHAWKEVGRIGSILATLLSMIKELKINMSDAVNSLYYIYDVCSSSYSKSPFAAVAEKICGRQDEIAKYSDCYQNTLEKSKCRIREAKTECEALEAFNANLDCAIVTMNDVCEVDAQNFVIELQEIINDMVIERKCLESHEKENAAPTIAANEDEFRLETKLTRCADEQENSALACLVELLEINKQLTQFQHLNFLLEIATENSSVVAHICELYSKYEKCLHASVFKNQMRCSFASPLNTLARIGLAPICSIDSRPLLSSHRDCLVKLAAQAGETSNCQSGLAGLGSTVNMMMQGIHSEALLCKSFYLIRNTFDCGERAVQQQCDAKALVDLRTLKNQMSQIGEEEGCPHEPPANLDEIIARPVKRPTLRPGVAPMARPLNTAVPLMSNTPSVKFPSSSSPPPHVPVTCSSEQQKRFEQCVRPLTAFQPHPLSVIKVPRQIEDACEEFKKFQTCVTDVTCHPLWAKGMTAMFSYACGEGNEQYKKIRQCLRKISAEDTVKECVTKFSRGAPTQACLSANALLTCAIAPIQTECNDETSDWVIKYVTKFATAIDSRCKLASQLPIGKVIGVGCTPEEEAIIDHCAAPLNDIGSRMEELFQGGLQAMIKNVNSLAPVFAGGCNLTDEFRQCASFLLSGRTPCVISSCMILAGEGICDQPDPTQAIDDNLSCVFAQVQEPSFARCIRSTLSTVKQFTLSSFRNVLPRFVDCTEELVRAKCGDTPIKILRAMSSPDICPVGPAPIVPVSRAKDPQRVGPQIDKPVVSIATGCSEQDMITYLSCESSIDPFSFRPISIIGDGSKWNEMCAAFEGSYRPCVEKMTCRFEPISSANIQLFDGICNRPLTLRDQKSFGRCLSNYTNSAVGQKCISGMASIDPMAADAPKKMCEALNSILTCAGNDIEKECGYDALLHVYEQHIQWAQAYNKSCVIQSPESRSVSTNTLDKSRDVEPLHVVRDETTPHSVPQKDPTTTVLTSDSEISPTSPTIVTTTSSEQPMTTTHQEDATAAGKG